MNYEKAFFFTAGLIAGVGAVCFVKSGKARKAAVAVASKGLELQERVAGMAERLKETMDDVITEAKYVNEQKTNES